MSSGDIVHEHESGLPDFNSSPRVQDMLHWIMLILVIQTGALVTLIVTTLYFKWGGI